MASDTRLIVDSATLYEMVSLFTLTDKSYAWARSGAEALTAALISPSRVEIASAPAPSGPASELYGELTSEMHRRLARRLIAHDPRPVADAEARRQETKSWVEHNSAAIARAYLLLRCDQNFHSWLELAQETAWVEHAGRFEGLFDTAFLSEIEAVLGKVDHRDAYGSNVPKPKDLEGLLKLSQRLSKRPNGKIDLPKSEIEALTHAYVVSALVRGYYHQRVALKRDVQLTRHPFRAGVFNEVREQQGQGVGTLTPYGIANTQSFLSRIIIADALKASSKTDMAYRWVASIENALKDQEIAAGLDPIDSEDRAFSKAVTIARRLGLATDDKRVRRYVAAGISVVASVPALLHLAFPSIHIPHPMMTSSLGLAAGPVSALVGPNDRIESKVHQSIAERRLRDLKEGGAGTISYGNYRLRPTAARPQTDD